MIESVKIGYLTYKVYLSEHPGDDDAPHLPAVADDKWLAGGISYLKGCIYIHDGLAEEVKRQTLLHEITHGVLRNAGHHADCDNEELVDAIAYGFMALIRDNPQLLTFLQEETGV